MTIFLILIVGLIFGSFLSVIFSRLEIAETGGKRPRKTDWKSIVAGRSRCDHCHKTIPWYDNVPLLSFVALKGRCRHCGKRISHYHPLLELTSGLFLVAAYLFYGVSWQLLVAGFFGLILLLVFAYDLRHQLIPDIVVLPAIGMALIILLYEIVAVPQGYGPSIMIGQPDPYAHLLGGLVLGGFFLLLSLLSRGTWIGGGDLKLGVLIGLLLGWQLALVALILSYLIGTVYAVVLLVSKEATLKSSVPFAPMLVSGFLIALFYGAPLIEWYQGWFL